MVGGAAVDPRPPAETGNSVRNVAGYILLSIKPARGVPIAAVNKIFKPFYSGIGFLQRTLERWNDSTARDLSLRSIDFRKRPNSSRSADLFDGTRSFRTRKLFNSASPREK